MPVLRNRGLKPLTIEKNNSLVLSTNSSTSWSGLLFFGFDNASKLAETFRNKTAALHIGNYKIFFFKVLQDCAYREKFICDLFANIYS